MTLCVVVQVLWNVTVFKGIMKKQALNENYRRSYVTVWDTNSKLKHLTKRAAMG